MGKIGMMLELPRNTKCVSGRMTQAALQRLGRFTEAISSRNCCENVIAGCTGGKRVEEAYPRKLLKLRYNGSSPATA